MRADTAIPQQSVSVNQKETSTDLICGLENLSAGELAAAGLGDLLPPRTPALTSQLGGQLRGVGAGELGIRVSPVRST